MTTCQQAPQVPSKHIHTGDAEEGSGEKGQSSINSRQANYVGNLKRALKSRQHFKWLIIRHERQIVPKSTVYTSVGMCVRDRDWFPACVCAVEHLASPHLSPPAPPYQRSLGYHFFPDNVLSTRCLFSRNAHQADLPTHPTTSNSTFALTHTHTQNHRISLGAIPASCLVAVICQRNVFYFVICYWNCYCCQLLGRVCVTRQQQQQWKLKIQLIRLIL